MACAIGYGIFILSLALLKYFNLIKMSDFLDIPHTITVWIFVHFIFTPTISISIQCYNRYLIASHRIEWGVIDSNIWNLLFSVLFFLLLFMLSLSLCYSLVYPIPHFHFNCFVILKRSVTYIACASSIYSFHEKYRKYKTFAYTYIQHSFIRFDRFWFRCNRRHMSVLVFLFIFILLLLIEIPKLETSCLALCVCEYFLFQLFSHIFRKRIESLGVFRFLFVRADCERAHHHPALKWEGWTRTKTKKPRTKRTKTVHKFLPFTK